MAENSKDNLKEKFKKHIKKKISNLIKAIMRFLYKKISLLVKYISKNKIIAFSCLLILFGGYAQYSHNMKLQKELKDIKTVEKEKKEEKRNLEKEVDLLNEDNEYLIIYARKHYIFIKDNENVVTLPGINERK